MRKIIWLETGQPEKEIMKVRVENIADIYISWNFMNFLNYCWKRRNVLVQDFVSTMVIQKVSSDGLLRKKQEYIANHIYRYLRKMQGK